MERPVKHGRDSVQEPNIAIPVELQIELAETRRSLAELRYDLSIRRGRSWDVQPKQSEKIFDV